MDKLRQTCPGLLSLVAEKDNRRVGHILFSPAVIDNLGQHIEGMGLAPMAVLPDHQYQGIGSMLVRRGIEILREQGCPFVLVLGHPEYYPRFGFERASTYCLSCQWEGVPDEAFMILILEDIRVKDVSGKARYRDEFNEAM